MVVSFPGMHNHGNLAAVSDLENKVEIANSVGGFQALRVFLGAIIYIK
jgi:hypothetical protein